MCLRWDGCGTHRRVLGFNKALYRAADGEDVEFDEFDDKGHQNVDVEQEGSGHDKAAEVAVVDAAAETYIVEHGYLPATFHGDYFEQRARKMSYAHAEQSLVSQVGLTKSEGLAKGKPAHGKRNKRGSVIAEGNNLRDSVQQLKGTYNGSAIQPKVKDRSDMKRSFAPKGAKPKKSAKTYS